MRWQTVLGATLVLAGTACGAASSSVDDDDADDATAEAALVEADAAAEGPAAPPGHGHGPPGGPMVLFREALADKSLSAEQKRSIQAALADLRPERGKHDHAEDAKAVADAVRAGKVDAAALRPADAPKPGDMHGKVVAALGKLHDTLDAGQRKALAQSIGARTDAAPDAPPKRGGPDPLRHLLADLDVSDAQSRMIEAALEKAGMTPPGPPSATQIADHKARDKALLAAFAQDDFDAATALAPPPAGMRGPDPLAVLEVVVPLLSVDQRDKLADRIEQGPPPGPPR